MTRPDGDSASEVILAGRPPVQVPPRVADIEELEKKAIDVFVYALKYIATTSGIVIAMYSQSVREYVKLSSVVGKPFAQFLLFAPLLLWFGAIIATVLGILPREYVATTDQEKELAVRRMRKTKRVWLKLAVWSFCSGSSYFFMLPPRRSGCCIPLDDGDSTLASWPLTPCPSPNTLPRAFLFLAISSFASRTGVNSQTCFFVFYGEVNLQPVGE